MNSGSGFLTLRRQKPFQKDSRNEKKETRGDADPFVN
jgi:hypothetical protein